MKTVLKIASVLIVSVIAYSFINSEMHEKQLRDAHKHAIEELRNNYRSNIKKDKYDIQDVKKELKKYNY